MKRLYSLLSVFSFIVFLSTFPGQIQAQCNPSNMFVTGTTTQTPDITTVAQSFTTIAACGSVQIGSITVYSTSSHSDATLKIFEGEGTGGAELYSGPVNLNDQGNLTPSVLPVNATVVVPEGAVFTFQISIPGTSGAFLNLFKSTTADLYTDGTLYQNGVSQPDQDLFFSVNTTAAVLPVELTAFEARILNNQIKLAWQTASEQNNEGFDVQRSTGGKDWENLGFVAGNGTTSEVSDYFFYDEKPLAGENYYRLRQSDFTGNFEYSPVKVVRFEGRGAAAGSVVSPNPVRAGQVLSVAGGGGGFTFLRLVDASGRLVEELAVSEDAVNFEIPAGLKSGMYFVVFYSAQGQSVEKIMVK
jgi:hypothetical protein